jgi:Domain of unknown function (DUF4184)
LPFTLAHPAAVLPLSRTKLVFSALVIGSMAPDFPYFLYASDNIKWGHSLPGIFFFCVPAGLLVLWLYERVVKRALLSLAPEFMRRRMSEQDFQFRFAPASTFWLIVVSLLIGILSHILWDGFTHDNGYFVQIWPWLSEPVELYGVHRLFKALQFVCSVIGLGLVGMAVAWHWFKSPVVTEPVAAELSPWMRWAVVVFGILVASVIGVAVALNRHHSHGWKWTTVQMIVAAISALCAEILLYSIAWQVVHRKNKKPQDPEIPGLKVMAER